MYRYVWFIVLIACSSFRPSAFESEGLSPQSCSSHPIQISDDNYEEMLAYVRMCQDLGDYMSPSTKTNYMHTLARLLRKGKNDFLNSTSLPEQQVRSVVQAINELYFELVFPPETGMHESAKKFRPWTQSETYFEEGANADGKALDPVNDNFEEGLEEEEICYESIPHFILLLLCLAVLLVTLIVVRVAYKLSELEPIA